MIAELVVGENTNHGVERPNAIHVLNAPSPAATSSLSVGLTVAETWARVVVSGK